MKPVAPFALALVLTATAIAYAQTPQFTDPANLRGERVAPLTGRELPIDQGARGLQQLLRKLNTRGTVMNIVAHPDDEDGGMLTLYSRGLGARVADLSLTRGEGGQNAMTGDFEDALGLLRTQELLSSDRYPGVDQFFGTEVDFGFSKTKEESFAKWGHERVLYDVVRAIRLYRPLVLTSTWIGGVTDGHGQHQVSGEIAQEAFVAAGDPKVFPELTAEGILPWQPLKIYARVPMQSISEKGLFDYATGQYTPARFTNYVTGVVTTTPPTADVVVHEGTVDPLLTDADGTTHTYVQFARIGLSLQKSQIGPGFRNPPPGAFDVAYHRYGSRLARQPEHETGFFDGIDTSIEGIADLAPDAPPALRHNLKFLQDAVERATKRFDPKMPTNSVMDLMEVLASFNSVIKTVPLLQIDTIEKANVLHELRVKQVQANDAVVLALGLKIDALAPGSDPVAGSTVQIKTRIDQQSDVTLPEVRESATNSEQVTTKEDRVFNNEGVVTENGQFTRTLEANAAQTSTVTKPYFFRDSIEQAVYKLSNPQLRLAPQTPPALTAWADLTLGVTTVRIGRIVHSAAQPVSFVPALSLALSSHAQVVPAQEKAFTVGLTETPPHANVTSMGLGAAGWEGFPLPAAANDPGHTDFQIKPPPSEERKPTTLRAQETLVDGLTYTEGYRPVGYGNLPRTNYYTPATDRVVPVDLKIPERHRIGYLPGTGDAVPEALASIGLKPEILSVADLTPAKLANFDTVILGVRTYNAHPELHGAPTQALLDYARGGGNVLVQYQTAEFTADDAPYPLTLGRDAEKVVDETDPVELLAPDASALTVPNRITPADFNGWIEERGHGFLSAWDPRYNALTETHDPGQLPQKGGLVTAQLGKGRWTYCAFALYRQLPEAVPGAYRLFLNLLHP